MPDVKLGNMDKQVSAACMEANKKNAHQVKDCVYLKRSRWAFAEEDFTILKFFISIHDLHTITILSNFKPSYLSALWGEKST